MRFFYFYHRLNLIGALLFLRFQKFREGFGEKMLNKTTLNLFVGEIMYTFPLKTIVSRAHCNGHLHRNPFAQYRIRPNVRERQFLTEEELQTMMNHHFANPALAKIRDIFVFGALTGISFIDIKNLTADNLEKINGGWWIVSKRQKTGVPFRVKLLDTAYRIIECYAPYRKNGRLFDFPGNQHTNKSLKQITKECGIDKPVCFHASRHSFATLALTKGMPIETVSKILGHTNIMVVRFSRRLAIFVASYLMCGTPQKAEIRTVAKSLPKPC